MSWLLYLLAALSYVRATTSPLTSIHLLALVPWPDDREHADWDAGPDLLTSARVAIQEINNSTSVLPNYELVLIESGHEACGLVGADFGLVNLVENAVNPWTSNPVAAVLGLFCSSSTKVLSPIAGAPGIDLIQLSGSNSPIFLTNKDDYPHLWRFLESATVHADAMVALMDAVGWTKAALIVDFDNLFFSGIGTAFINKLKARADMELVYRGALLQLNNIESTFQGILDNRARIIFLSTTAPQAARIFCLAAENRMKWPNYVWVMADYLADVILDHDYCSQEQLLDVMEDSLITYFSLKPDNYSQVLVSNGTYQDYRDKYKVELKKVKEDYPNVTIPGEPLYGGIIYDEVWAFALALHEALPELESKNLSIATYGFGQPRITAILEKYLQQVDFIGATGRISFTNNSEVSNTIKIYQVKNGTEVTVGVYDARMPGDLTITITNPPSDELETKTTLYHISVLIILVIVTVAVTLLVTVVGILLIILRNHVEIRASSPKLTILIFSGCYIECIAASLIVLQYSYEWSEYWFTIFCNLEIWFGLIGIYLIIATNLLKVARIFRIFTHFGKTGKFWSDPSLICLILLICVLPCLLLFVWVPLDLLQYTSKSIYHTEKIPVYIELLVHCSCQYYNLWTGLLYAYVGILMFGLIFFAVQTRHINRQSFKDTKKVNAFAFFMIFVFGLFFTMHQVLNLLQQYIYSNVALCFMYLSISFICQLFLFIPKVLPALFETIRTRTIKSRVRHSHNSEEGRSSPHTFTRSVRQYSRKSSAFISQLSQVKLIY